MWEKEININDIKEIRVKTTVYFGIGAITKISDISTQLKNMGIDKILIMTGKNSYKSTGAWDHVEKSLNANEIEYILYDKVTPNPNVVQVDEAAELGKKFGAKAVIGIGGGSPIDAAKGAAILLEYPDKNATELYEFNFTPEKAVPIIAINLTHGTGTEVDRFAVTTIEDKEYKPAIAYDCIYPLYAIDDPALMVSLPKNQTLYVSVDAINHVIEAATTTVSNPFDVLLAKETIRLVVKYLPKALENPNDLEARYYLLYASMIAGTSFDNGLLHFTHALEHPLSGVKPELTHGLGLGMLLPSIIKQIYVAKPNTLAAILSPMVEGLTGDPSEVDKASEGVRKWLHTVGLTEKLSDMGYVESDIEKLTKLVFETPGLSLLVSLAPVDGTEDVVRQIYTDSF
ncbi:iron-containing alcohol dehydrogenase [Clostridium aestuarii]|uniref:Iron-containing alcohol dehydrogenase n=1 Tax=Clostridium aestuarii TaxID=338193 RepID=A0ABT4CUZ9_9CLOT|nr:iron-containing alcohol dehydrogenase [Clostridium aestuarii]MCY6482803.1 iron-containing alcohol dehydrogenase [Clostridium aestuarii]